MPSNLVVHDYHVYSRALRQARAMVSRANILRPEEHVDTGYFLAGHPYFSRTSIQADKVLHNHVAP